VCSAGRIEDTGHRRHGQYGPRRKVSRAVEDDDQVPVPALVLESPIDLAAGGSAKDHARSLQLPPISTPSGPPYVPLLHPRIPEVASWPRNVPPHWTEQERCQRPSAVKMAPGPWSQPLTTSPSLSHSQPRLTQGALYQWLQPSRPSAVSGSARSRPAPGRRARAIDPRGRRSRRRAQREGDPRPAHAATASSPTSIAGQQRSRLPGPASGRPGPRAAGGRYPPEGPRPWRPRTVPLPGSQTAAPLAGSLPDAGARPSGGCGVCARAVGAPFGPFSSRAACSLAGGRGRREPARSRTGGGATTRCRSAAGSRATRRGRPAACSWALRRAPGRARRGRAPAPGRAPARHPVRQRGRPP
jgi:hypothetical protein